MDNRYKAKILNGHYLGSDDIYLNFPCEIHFTRFGDKQQKIQINDDQVFYENINFIDNNNYKVFVCSNEPTTSYNRETVNHIINNSFQYDLILTTDKKILENTTNSVFFPYGTTWLNKDKHHIDALGKFDDKLLEDINDKIFNVSFVTTNRRNKDGYELRYFIWNNRNLIKIPTLFYSSTRDRTNVGGYSTTLHDGLLPNDDKINLFKSQFSIAIESTKEDSYFSEKLIDCLLTKTIPVYWGAPNIGDFFDIRGFIVFDNYEDFIKKINTIDENTYEKLKPYIEINFHKAKEYGRPFFHRIKEKIEQQWNNEESNKDILWTIGILTLPERKSYLDRLLKHLNKTTPIRCKHRIEILINEDSGENTVGYKRAEVLAKARGKYISFIDDDDMVSVSYISKLFDLLNTNQNDAIGFMGKLYHDGVPKLIFSHSQTNNGHYKSECGKIQFRPINHLNPVRIDIAREIGFPNLNFSEDMDYCDRLYKSKLIKKEYYLSEILYYYLYESTKSKTH